MVAHYKNTLVSLSDRPFVKLESLFVKPARARFLVVFERKPQPLKLSYLFAVFVSLKVNDVGDAQVSQPFHVRPGGYSTAKG
jgi:hypothetical protein